MQNAEDNSQKIDKEQCSKNPQTIRLHQNELVNKILLFDYTSVKKINGMTDNLEFPMKFVSFIGTVPFWCTMAASYYIYGDLSDIKSIEYFGLLLFSAILLSGITMTAIKYIFKRKRPYMEEKFQSVFHVKIKNRDPFFGSRQQSFPSGHVGYIAMFSIVFSSFYGGNVLIPFFIFIPAIMLARIYLGCHYPSDVVMGVVIGFITGILTLILFDPLFLPMFQKIWIVLKIIFPNID
jgi:membrane-associated phospholipid phosphatase